MENQGCLGVFSPSFILCVIFIFLKVFEVVDWSWWVVFIPLWLPFALIIGFYLVCVIAYLFLLLISLIYRVFIKR